MGVVIEFLWWRKGWSRGERTMIEGSEEAKGEVEIRDEVREGGEEVEVCVVLGLNSGLQLGAK